MDQACETATRGYSATCPSSPGDGQPGDGRGRRRFGTGGARKCRCQALKTPGWIWRDTTQEQRDAAQLEQTGCGTDGPTSGLIGYLDGEPAGWVAVEPRDNYPRIWNRKQPWMRMDPDLDGVWSVTCFVVRKGFRRQGLMYELAAATVEYGRHVGAHLLEGYPTQPAEGKTRFNEASSVAERLLDAGYEVVACRPFAGGWPAWPAGVPVLSTTCPDPGRFSEQAGASCRLGLNAFHP
jgi:GNAT superfamily N-acetyltransferase